MKDLLKHYWFDILIVVGFIVFTFVIPKKSLSIASAVIIAVCLIQIVTHDNRIKDPYSSIMAVAIIVACGIFMNMFWK